MTSGIYAIVHVDTGRSYVGSSSNIKKRWAAHLSDLRKGRHHARHLQNAWNKYGDGAFVFVVLEVVEDKSSLFVREQIYLDAFGELNCYPVAGSSRGHKHSEETKKAWSEMRRGSGNSFFGKSHTEETRAKLRAINLGKRLSEEAREKIRKVHVWNKYCLGKKASQDTRAKLSASKLGKPHSEEHRAALADANRKRGRFVTWQGKEKTISEWAREIGCGEATIRGRINAGLSIEQVFTSERHAKVRRPPKSEAHKNAISAAHGGLLTLGDKTQSIRAWAREVGISHGNLQKRIRKGWSLERALTTPRTANG